jgi:hypothetical protein
MNKDDFTFSLSLLGAMGLAVQLMPNIEKIWEGDPDDPVLLEKLRTGQMIFVGIVAFLAIGGAITSGSLLPIFVVGSIGLIFLSSQSYALHFSADLED